MLASWTSFEAATDPDVNTDGPSACKIQPCMTPPCLIERGLWPAGQRTSRNTQARLSGGPGRELLFVPPSVVFLGTVCPLSH